MLKKIAILYFIFFATIIYCNQKEDSGSVLKPVGKIVNLKVEIGKGKAFFLLVDENKNANYGHYEFSKINNFAKDFTSEPYKDKVDIKLINKLGNSFAKNLNSFCWTMFFGITSTLAFSITPLYFYTAYQDLNNPGQELRDFSLALNYSLGGSFLGIGALFLISFGILLPFAIRDYKKYKRIKEDIINLLNGVAILKKKNKIKISFAIDFPLSKIDYN